MANRYPHTYQRILQTRPSSMKKMYPPRNKDIQPSFHSCKIKVHGAYFQNFYAADKIYPLLLDTISFVKANCRSCICRDTRETSQPETSATRVRPSDDKIAPPQKSTCQSRD